MAALAGLATSGAVPLITPAFADAIAPTAFFLPGCLFMALGAALPATVLAGVLERPFVTRAGVKRHALCYSLQANLVSAALGILCTPLAIVMLYECPLFWLLLAVTISICSEGLYYCLFALDVHQELRWRWIVLGNIFSSAVLFAFAPILGSLEERYSDTYWQLASRLERYHDRLLWSGLAASVVIFIWSFVVTCPAGRRAGSAETAPARPSTMAEHAAQDALPSRDPSGAAAP
jgi:hypothetical protein